MCNMSSILFIKNQMSLLNIHNGIYFISWKTHPPYFAIDIIPFPQTIHIKTYPFPMTKKGFSMCIKTISVIQWPFLSLFPHFFTKEQNSNSLLPLQYFMRLKKVFLTNKFYKIWESSLGSHFADTFREKLRMSKTKILKLKKNDKPSPYLLCIIEL